MFDMFQLPFMVQAFVAAVITGVLLSYMGYMLLGGELFLLTLPLDKYLPWELRLRLSLVLVLLPFR
jgi:hypothetical protein